MHTVAQRLMKDHWVWIVQFAEPGSDPGYRCHKHEICRFRWQSDAFAFCSYLNGGAEPALTENGREDLAALMEISDEIED